MRKSTRRSITIFSMKIFFTIQNFFFSFFSSTTIEIGHLEIFFSSILNVFARPIYLLWKKIIIPPMFYRIGIIVEVLFIHDDLGQRWWWWWSSRISLYIRCHRSGSDSAHNLSVNSIIIALWVSFSIIITIDHMFGNIFSLALSLSFSL